jgi:hypothetical protein
MAGTPDDCERKCSFFYSCRWPLIPDGFVASKEVALYLQVSWARVLSCAASKLEYIRAGVIELRLELDGEASVVIDGSKVIGAMSSRDRTVANRCPSLRSAASLSIKTQNEQILSVLQQRTSGQGITFLVSISSTP